MRWLCSLLPLLVLLLLPAPAAAQTGSLSAQVLRLLVRDNTWTGLNDFQVDTDGSGGIKITNGTPASTTGKLYAVGGNLFWSGSLLGVAPGGTGTVTSVALTAPGIFSVSGSPVTSAGTLSFSLATQVANTIFAGPATGADATPTFRALVDADVPDTITIASTNNVTWASVSKSGSTLADLATRSASDLTTGTLALARITDDGTAGIPLVSGGGGGDPQYAALNLGSSTAATGTLAAARFPALTGEVTTSAGSLTTALSTTGVGAGSYGSATAIPILTIDTKGRITAASTASLSSSISPSVLSGGSRGGMLIANASNQYAASNPSVLGQVPRYNGSDTVWSLDGSAFTGLNATNLATGTVGVAVGGTGNTSTPANGQLWIGNGTATPSLATLTGTANQVTVVNAAGSITLSTPQALATASTPQFARIGAGTGADATAAVYAFGPLKHRIVANGSVGATLTLNLDQGDWQTLTLTANCTFTFSAPVAGTVYRLMLTQDGVGSHTVTWPTIRWAGGAAPTLTITAGKTDIITCLYDGTSYFCDAQLNY